MISAPSFDGDSGPSKTQNEPARCAISRPVSVEGSEAAILSNCRSDAPVPSAGTTGPMDFSLMTFAEAEAYLSQLTDEAMSMSRKAVKEGREYETPEEEARFAEIGAEMRALAEVHKL